MCTVKDMRERMAGINLTEEARTVMQATETTLTDLNKKQLFEKGQDSKGRELRPYADARSLYGYAHKKNQMNPQPGFGIPDLKLTGRFYAGWKIEIKGNEYSEMSTDSKAPDLIAMFGADLFGLQDDNKTEYRETTLLPGMARNICTKTGALPG